MENSVRDKEYECPFGRCSQQLVKILCELLNVGAPISDTGNDIQPMFFTSGDIFEELYSVTIQLLNKTWKEMRATTSDISRVTINFLFFNLQSISRFNENESII